MLEAVRLVHFVGPWTGPLPPTRTAQTASGHLSYMITGRGPSILLFNGAGISLAGWRPLFPGIARLGTVFGWNRFRIHDSNVPQPPQDGAQAIASLRELLAHTRVQPPYLLVAHSVGGLYANLFARLHPQEVAGVLFLESMHPDDPEVLSKHENQWVRALGKVLALPQRLFQRNVHADLQGVTGLVREIAAAGPFPPVPVRVVTGGQAPRMAMLSRAAINARQSHQSDLAHLSPMGEQVLAPKSGHFPQLSEPDLVLQVLEDLLEVCAWDFREQRA